MTPDDSNSLENARNQVFRMCRYGFKKIRRKNIDFSQSYDGLITKFFFGKKNK